jgi:hypothetical protein
MAAAGCHNKTMNSYKSTRLLFLDQQKTAFPGVLKRTLHSISFHMHYFHDTIQRTLNQLEYFLIDEKHTKRSSWMNF